MAVSRPAGVEKAERAIDKSAEKETLAASRMKEAAN